MTKREDSIPVSTPFTGGCACGSVRYECSAAPLWMFHCRCRDCQRASGSAFAANVFVPGSSLTYIAGEPKYHGITGGSGNTVYRGFCQECGSPLEAKTDRGDVKAVSAASLDDPGELELLANLWTSSAHPWDTLPRHIPEFETQPTQEEFQALLATRR